MIEALKELLKKSKKTWVFTGAGVSTLSGIKDFRGLQGIYSSAWHGLAVEDILSLDFFLREPAIFYQWAKEFVYQLDSFSPSIVHTVLGEMEKKKIIEGVYTQNIDLLHQRGGSRFVGEIHGSPSTHHCLSCGMLYTYEQIAPIVLADKVPSCTQCKGIIKPDIIFYGEQLNGNILDRAYRDMGGADLLLILGSSLTVQPAASLPMATYYHGGRLVIVNAQKTPLDKYAKLRFHDLKETFDQLEEWVYNL
jgi:NAD-dependent deacetylase